MPNDVAPKLLPQAEGLLKRTLYKLGAYLIKISTAKQNPEQKQNAQNTDTPNKIGSQLEALVSCYDGFETSELIAWLIKVYEIYPPDKFKMLLDKIKEIYIRPKRIYYSRLSEIFKFALPHTREILEKSGVSQG